MRPSKAADRTAELVSKRDVLHASMQPIRTSVPNRIDMHAVKRLCAATLILCSASAQALTINFDYSLDTGNFFSSDKRSVLDQVASIFENNLSNSLAALSHVNVNRPDMQYYNSQTGNFTSIPGTAISAPLQNIAADSLLIFVGAVDLPTSMLGLGTQGTARANRVNGSYNGYGSGWGGQMVFDTTMDMSAFGGGYTGQVAPRQWYVDDDIRSAEALSTTKIPVTPGGSLQNGYFLLKDIDFASIVMHEMGHLFGLQHSTNFNDAMYPTTVGERSFFEANDWNAMSQRGWQVSSTTPDLDSVVTQPTATLPTPVPEPTTAALLLAGLTAAWGVTRRRRQS